MTTKRSCRVTTALSNTELQVWCFSALWAPMFKRALYLHLPPPPLSRPFKPRHSEKNGVNRKREALPFIIRGENPSAGRIVAVLRFPDTGRTSLLIIESGAGRHGRGVVRVYSGRGWSRWRRKVLKGAQTPPLSPGRTEGWWGKEEGEWWCSGHVIFELQTQKFDFGKY